MIINIDAALLYQMGYVIISAVLYDDL